MRRTTIALLRLAAPGAFLCLCLISRAGDAERPALIPQPAHVEYSDGWFQFRDGTQIVIPPDCSPEVADAAELLRSELRERSSVDAEVVRATPPASGALVLVLDPSAAQGGEEAYTLRIGENVEIRASRPRGLIWGLQTMLQSFAMHEGTAALRRGVIIDRPARQWRALLLDPSRSFQSLEFIRRTIRVMSAYKMNVLHLHLTDDTAWRFESRAFPKLNPPGEPFYTQDELRDLVAFAARHGVEIVPEFDFPGHARAAVAAYPELDCDGQARGADEAILCCGKPFTWEFMERIVAEAAAVFPSPYIHLGADEPFALHRWQNCPSCRERMREKGVDSLQALYHSFVLDLDAIAGRHGKTMIVWNDAFRPGVGPAPTKDIVIDAWRDFANANAFAEAGYTIVNSTTGPLYLTSYGLRGGLPLDAVLEWNATRFANPDPRLGDKAVNFGGLSVNATLLGGQACAWATEQGLVERRLYPRLLSIAGSLWSERGVSDRADFEARLHPAHEQLLHTLGIDADEAHPVQTLFDGKNTDQWSAVGEPEFSIENGELVMSSESSRGWLRSRGTYRDFILSFEQWSPGAGDATGVAFGCDPSLNSGPAPDGRLISAAQVPGFPGTGSLHPARTWNRYQLVVRRGILTLTVNDRLAWSVAVPGAHAGAIGLAAGGGIRFRAIQLRPLEQETSP